MNGASAALQPSPRALLVLSQVFLALLMTTTVLSSLAQKVLRAPHSTSYVGYFILVFSYIIIKAGLNVNAPPLKLALT